MKWLIDLEFYNIGFTIKTLSKDEYIVLYQKNYNHKILYILDGFIQSMQVFTNGEVVSLKLLYKNDTFTNIETHRNSLDNNKNYYYQFRALTYTILVIINRKEILQRMKLNYHQYYHCNYKNQEMISILSHKYTKKRLVQLLLILTKRFGVISNSRIYIPINLSHYSIATIVGSQRITVNRIMNQLKPSILYYDDKQIIIFNLIKLIQY